MKIAIDDIKASPKELSYVEEVEELNTRLGRGGARDYRLPTGLSVDVTHYRAGLEVFFHGVLHAQVLGSCARCLEEYAFGLDYPFAFVLMPRVAAGPRPTTLSASAGLMRPAVPWVSSGRVLPSRTSTVSPTSR